MEKTLLTNHARGSIPPTVLVTGGTGFLGTRIIKRLLEKDVHVLLHSRNDQRAKVAVEKIEQGTKVRGNITAISFDFTESSIADFAQTTKSLDAVIHCAAARPPSTSVDDILAEEFARVLHDNVLSTFFLIRGIAPILKHSSQNNMVILSSGVARTYLPYYQGAHYAASKGAIESLVIQLGVELYKKTGMTINALSPERVCRDNESSCVSPDIIANRAVALAIANIDRKTGQIFSFSIPHTR